jgi:hypothetical protein
MATRRFWQPVIVSLIATPVALLLGFMSAGMGHGDYFVATLLFPYTMLSTGVFEEIILPFVLLALVQFPAYGFIIGRANERRQAGRVGLYVLAAHAAATVAALAFAGPGFSQA